MTISVILNCIYFGTYMRSWVFFCFSFTQQIKSSCLSLFVKVKFWRTCLSGTPPPPHSHGPLHHAVAVPAPPAGGPAAASPDLLDRWRWRVQAAGRWRGRTSVGAPQEQTQHELRQTEPSTAILLRQGTTDDVMTSWTQRGGKSQVSSGNDIFWFSSAAIEKMNK